MTYFNGGVGGFNDDDDSKESQWSMVADSETIDYRHYKSNPNITVKEFVL